MSLKKNILRWPWLTVGIIMAVILGGCAVAAELLKDQFPTIGLVILFVTPVATVVLKEIASRAFPDLWERIARRLLGLYRYLLNDDFRLRFQYEMRFAMPGTSSVALTTDLVCKTINAAPGQDPDPSFLGTNYIHLRYSQSPFLVSITWHIENHIEESEAENPTTVFHLRMEPETRVMTMRRAKEEIIGTITRLQKLQQPLVAMFGREPETLLVADAWFGERPTPSSIPEKKIDKETGAEYQLIPNLLRVTGRDLASLRAVYGYVGGLTASTVQ